jgi:Na+/citrate or Na+/malate symporter
MHIDVLFAPTMKRISRPLVELSGHRSPKPSQREGVEEELPHTVIMTYDDINKGTLHACSFYHISHITKDIKDVATKLHFIVQNSP